MRIENGHLHNLLKAYASDKKKTSLPNDGVSKHTSDTLEISPQAKLLQKAYIEGQKLPDVRQEVVDKIKNAIKDGTYRFDSKDIAQAMAKNIISDGDK